MTTHQELFETFINGETSPRTASNMEIIADSAGSRAALVSGRGGSHPGIVIAIHEPIDRVIKPRQVSRIGGVAWQQVSTRTRTIRDHYRHFSNYVSRNHPDNRVQTVDELGGEGYPNPNDVLTEI